MSILHWMIWNFGYKLIWAFCTLCEVPSQKYFLDLVYCQSAYRYLLRGCKCFCSAVQNIFSSSAHALDCYLFNKTFSLDQSVFSKISGFWHLMNSKNFITKEKAGVLTTLLSTHTRVKFMFVMLRATNYITNMNFTLKKIGNWDYFLKVAFGHWAVSYTHLTLPTTPYV